MTVYHIEPIGAQFKDSDLPQLISLFNNRAKEGFKFHSVFQVSQPTGCLGGAPTHTYLAIYQKEIDEAN